MSMEELEKELEVLKNRVAYIEDYLVKTTNVPPIAQTVSNWEPVEEKQVRVAQETVRVAQEPVRVQPVPVPQPKKSMFREEVVGKNVMGVLASILIFIGLCSLGALVYSSLTDVMKSGIVHLISFVIMGVGLWRVGKKKNAFSLSLSAIGISSVYIAIMIDAWLGIIDPLFMGVLIIAWGLLDTVIAFKYKSSLFSVISYIGFSMGVYLGVGEFYDSAPVVLALFIFQLSYSVMLLHKKYWESDTFKNIMSFISLIAQSAFIWTACFRDIPAIYTGIYYALALGFLVYSAYMYYLRSQGGDFAAFISCGLILVCSVDHFFAVSLDDSSSWVHLLTGAMMYISSVAMGRRKISGTHVYDYIAGILGLQYIFALWDNWWGNGVPEQSCLALMLFSAVILQYFMLRDKHYKHVGVTVGVLSLWCLPSPEFYGSMWAGLLLLAYGGIFAAHAYVSVRDNNPVCKVVVFGVLWGALFRAVGMLDLNDMVLECCWIMVSSVLLAAASLSGYCTRYESAQELCSRRKIARLDGSFYAYVVATYFILASLLIYMLDVESVPYMLLYTLLSLLLCCMNSNPIFEKCVGSSGYILGIQYTIYAYAMLHIWTGKYDIEFVYSLVCLVIAVLCILGGFYIKEKSFRIYGLFLSIICVLKLVFIDISYDNSIARVMGYIVGGFICLFIVGVYNKIEQRQRGDE